MCGIFPAATPTEPTVSHTPTTFTLAGCEYLSSDFSSAVSLLVSPAASFVLQRPDAFFVSLLVASKKLDQADG